MRSTEQYMHQLIGISIKCSASCGELRQPRNLLIRANPNGRLSMKYCIVFAIAVVLFAQSTSKSESDNKMETCGTPKGHECSCLRRTLEKRDKLMKECRDSGGSASDCLAKNPFHCDLVDEPEYNEGEDGGSTKETQMTDYCARNCKRHDCKCDDGPVCHIAHQAADHKTP